MTTSLFFRLAKMLCIPVDDVKVDRSTLWLRKLPVAELPSLLDELKERDEALEACRSDGDRPLLWDSSSGGSLPSALPLLNAAYLSFAKHRPLVLSPDALWITVLQGVAHHATLVPAPADGRTELRVRNNKLQRDGDAAGWEETLPQFLPQIEAHVRARGNAALADAVRTRFGSTTATSHTAASASFMSALQKYFRYTVETLCGVPRVLLRGSRADWTALGAAVEALLDGFQAVPSGGVTPGPRALDLQAWKRKLKPLLDRIAESFDDPTAPATRGFWRGVFQEHGSDESGGPLAEVSGWLAAFVGYLGDGRINPLASDVCRSVDIAEFPVAVCRTPFRWEYKNESLDMGLYGGLVGVNELSTSDEETNAAVEAVTGWMIGRKV